MDTNKKGTILTGILLVCVLLLPMISLAAEDTATSTVYAYLTKANYQPEFPEIPDLTLYENSLFTFTVLASDPDGETITYSIDPPILGATLSSETGFFSWTPDYYQSGVYIIEFSVTDGTFTVTQTVTITVNDVNGPPDLLDPPDSYDLVENEPITDTIPVIDPDPGDMDDLDCNVFMESSSCTCEIVSGILEFTCTPRFGDDEITIEVWDPAHVGGPTVIFIPIILATANHPPVLDLISDQTILEQETRTILITATDLDGDIPTYSSGPLPPGAQFYQANHTFVWTPTCYQSGTYEVEFFVTDPDGASDSQTVMMVVDDVNCQLPPEFPDPDPYIPPLIKNVDNLIQIPILDPDEDDENKLECEVILPSTGCTCEVINGILKAVCKPYEQDNSITVTVVDPEGHSVTITVPITVISQGEAKQGAGGYTSYFTSPFSVEQAIQSYEQQVMPPGGELPPSVAEDEIEGKEVITTPIYKQVAKVGTVSTYFRFDRGNCKMLTKIRTEILDIFDQSVQETIVDTVEGAGLVVQEMPFIITATLEPPCTTGNSTLYITVPEQWVLEQGGVDSLRIVHISDSGEAELLTLECVACPDKDGNYRLKVDTAHFSIYGMVSVKAKEAAGVTTPPTPSVEPMLVPGGVGFASYVTENPILVAAVAVILIAFAVLEMKFHILRRKEYKHLGAPPEGGPPAWEGLLETDHHKALAGIMEVLNEIDEQLLRLNAMFARPQFALAPSEAEAIVEKFFYACQVAEERIKNAAAAEHLTSVQIEKLNTQLSAAVQRMVETSQQSQVLYQLVQAKVGAGI